MKSILQFSIFLLFTNLIYAQVGIGTPNPDSSAMLQINSKNKGVLLPSIPLASLTDNTTIPNPAEGLLVWNNGTGGLIQTGYYYWSSAKWNLISVSSAGSGSGGGNGTNGNATNWNNSGTNSGNFAGANTNLSLGTNTSDDLVLKVNSSKIGRLGIDNSVSLGTGANAGQNGIAIGNSSSAFQGVAIGNGSSVTANEALSVGNNASASAFQSNAVGFNAKATKNEASAFGNNSQAGGFQSVAIGYNAKTNTNSETALGYNTVTNNQNSTALGAEANALGQFSTAVGYGASTSQANAIVLGNNNANVAIGTGTPNTAARLDVNGQYKLGEKGSVNKNQISFEVWPSVSINNLPSGRSTTLNITIPSSLLPGSTRASITVSPAGDFAGNTTFSISNPRMTSTSNITINLSNISANAESLYSGHFYVTINEF
ncbi:hypothetical protein M2347_003281 [Chryseobacterium sp. H1D6B]|uniref:hypothetical protein n=1 Tax=Chryseobacterium sp. H1D6B TaxID=2940588 RepID=UPI0015CAF1A9|nr:hypothetical protein [Chryseobacterium sp. H1D6B]MDH6253554.1 hypothetical protein [Chryseobacterium sp. H1D6B]